MRIEKHVPKGREILSFIIDTAIYEMEREKEESVKKQFLISKEGNTKTQLKKEISKKHCVMCSKDSFVVDWRKGRKSFVISFEETKDDVIKIYYILVEGTQVYKYASDNPERVLIFKVNTKA